MIYVFSTNKKTLDFLEVALGRLQVRGLDILKIKESRQIFVGMTVFKMSVTKKFEFSYSHYL
jgi:hypothetical protein